MNAWFPRRYEKLSVNCHTFSLRSCGMFTASPIVGNPCPMLIVGRSLLPAGFVEPPGNRPPLWPYEKWNSFSIVDDSTLFHVVTKLCVGKTESLAKPGGFEAPIVSVLL